MKTTTKKISIELPTKIAEGLTTRDLHPSLARSQQTASDVEQALERARRDLAERERVVASLPERITRGEVKASALTDALRDRDAAALLIPPAEVALAKARERVSAEEKNASRALEREIERRHHVLVKAAAEIAPILEELASMATALTQAESPTAIPCSPEWPCSPACDAHHRVMQRGLAVASANWTPK